MAFENHIVACKIILNIIVDMLEDSAHGATTTEKEKLDLTSESEEEAIEDQDS